MIQDKTEIKFNMSLTIQIDFQWLSILNWSIHEGSIANIDININNYNWTSTPKIEIKHQESINGAEIRFRSCAKQDRAVFKRYKCNRSKPHWKLIPISCKRLFKENLHLIKIWCAPTVVKIQIIDILTISVPTAYHSTRLFNACVFTLNSVSEFYLQKVLEQR